VSAAGRLAGKTAVITGAGRPGGIGQGIAHRLAAEGARIVLHDLGRVSGEIAPAHGVGTSADLDATADALRATGAEVRTFCGDVLIEKDVADLMDFARDSFGSLDIVVNNAGIGYLFGPLTEMTEEKWDAVLGVNLRGVFFGIKHAARHMIPQGTGGRIISIASQAAKTGFAFASAYTASKHGVVGLTRSAALELAPHRITVNAVCPNHITTGLGAWQNDFMSKAHGKSVDAYLADMRARIPLGRTGRVEDIAAACAFLCSDDAAYITAEAMNVSGGEEYH
jgi:meso-butanediol dehydrogenase/(S,S)-butanediol dehydrogenase/diacetyl reductase